MKMSGRGSRDRFRRDHPPPTTAPSSSSPPPLRFEEKSRSPPSRHLWVGNLSYHVTESLLTDQFIRYGDLENVAFQPGRSYAFINFVREEDAFEAMKALEGVSLAGGPLRIQFAKADKMPALPREESYLQRREDRVATSSPFSQRESWVHASAPDVYVPENFKDTGSSSEAPSEVLWIGFPAFLKVDEAILRKAFSPFGEIEKITLFPGRTYAFLRFRNLVSACRAKDALQGKLFGNPRVHICFAKSESGSSSTGKRSAGMNAPHPQHFRSNGRVGSSDEYHLEKDFRSPPIRTNLVKDTDYRNPDVMGFRKESFRSGGNSGFDQRRIRELGPELGPTRGYCHSPARDAPHYREFSPSNLNRRSPFVDEFWDLSDDPHLYREPKKLKTSGPFHVENELPDYSFSDSDKNRYGFRKMFSDTLLADETGRVGHNRFPDFPVNSRQYSDRVDHLMSSHDTYQPDVGSFPLNRVQNRRLMPSQPQPSLSREWKWQGTIAKGGTPVCRARCFPVGKVLDFTLPEVLDCTARTGLDMLAKHYYQATGTWVVFFVPESDADMAYYNEFMNFLEEKQRAAVAKLDEENTLFLVPPSEFSEKVLKVAGRLSISGVVLRLESAPAPLERKDTSYNPSHGDRLYPRSDPVSTVPYAPSPRPTQNLDLASQYPISQATSMLHGTTSTTHHDINTHDYAFSGRNLGQGLNSGGAMFHNKPLPAEQTRPVSSLPMNFPIGGLQPEQIAQLAASLLGQQQHEQLSGSVASAGGDERQLGLNSRSENPLTGAHRYDPGQATHSHFNISQISVAQQPQLQQQAVGTNVQGAESDPQRVQATLQLAATLLQQMQQGKGP